MTEAATKWTSFPITHKYIDVSTAHITKEDNEILGLCLNDEFWQDFPKSLTSGGVIESDIAPTGYGFDQGYWVWTGLGTGWATEARREGSKLSESFINLYERAAHSDADWMKIDCNGMIYDDLPKYVW